MQTAMLPHAAACHGSRHYSRRFSCWNRNSYTLALTALMGAGLSGEPLRAHAAEPAASASTQITGPSTVSSSPVAAPATGRPHAKPKRPIAEEHLDSWFQTVSLSYLLSHNADALRRQDVSAGYFVSEQAGGNLVPALKPWRERLRDKGFSFEFTYKGEGMGNIAGGISKGMDYTHEVRASMLFDLGRLTDWHPLEGWAPAWYRHEP